jgi:hypothetical protein
MITGVAVIGLLVLVILAGTVIALVALALGY